MTQSMYVSNIVQLVNEGTTIFNMKYGPRDRLILQPGQSVMVPEEVAWHYLGRWWMDNTRRDRVGEYQRLRTLYGAYDDDILWQQNKPLIVAYLPTGQRITTVVDDPDGTAGQVVTTPLAQTQSLEAQLEVMRDQMLVLQAKLEGRAREEANVAQPNAPTDASPPPPGIPPFQGPVAPGLTVGGIPIPVAPPVIPNPTGVGQTNPLPPDTRLPVSEGIAYQPPDPDDVPTDDPARIPTGAGRVRGRA